MAKYRHFFWDFDGTLYDSYPRIERAFQKALKEMGLSCEADRLSPLLKITLYEACVQLAGPDQADELLRRYFDHAEDEGPETLLLYPGAKEALHALKASGGVHYLYTHRDETALEALKRDGLLEIFHDAVTHEAGFPSKPAPDALLWLMQQHGLDPADCAMIGDREIDVKAGQNALMDGILFDPDGFCPEVEAQGRYHSFEALAQGLG